MDYVHPLRLYNSLASCNMVPIHASNCKIIENCGDIMLQGPFWTVNCYKIFIINFF